MRRGSIALVLMLAVVALPGAALAAPPPNDAFASATVVSAWPTTTSADLREATLQSGEPQCGPSTAGSVWYRFTPAGNQLILDTDGTSIGHAIGLFTGTSLSALQNVACFSTSSGGNRVQWGVSPGQSYYLRVSDYNGRRGVVSLYLHNGSAPPNSSYDTALTISSLPFTQTVDTTFAPADAFAPRVCGRELGNAVWYRVTSTTERFLSADTFGSGFDTILGVLSQQPVGSKWTWFEDGCNDYYGGPQSRVVWRAFANRPYYLVVGGDRNDYGVARIRVEAPARPANDTMATAAAVSSFPFTHTVDNRAAVYEIGEPRPACAVVSVGTVWYRFTAGGASVRTLSAVGSTPARSFPAFVAAYALVDGRLLPVACANSSTRSARLVTTPGTTYLIQAGGDSAAIGYSASTSDSDIREETGSLTVSIQ